MQMWSEENEVIKLWLRENRYTSHQAVNEIIKILGKAVLCNLLKKITGVSGPAWFSVIADEVTDIVHAEQLNLSIHWVNDIMKFMNTLLDCAGCQILRQRHCLKLLRIF